MRMGRRISLLAGWAEVIGDADGWIAADDDVAGRRGNVRAVCKVAARSREEEDTILGMEGQMFGEDELGSNADESNRALSVADGLTGLIRTYWLKG